MTPTELDAIRQRADKATPGLVCKACGGHSVVLSPVDPRHNDRRIPAYGFRDENGWSIAYPFIEDDGRQRMDFVCFKHDDARLFANARADIVALLAYVARLEAATRQMATVLRAYEVWHGEVVLDAACWANDDGALVHGRHLDRLIEIQDERNAALANYASEGGRHDD